MTLRYFGQQICDEITRQAGKEDGGDSEIDQLEDFKEIVKEAVERKNKTKVAETLNKVGKTLEDDQTDIQVTSDADIDLFSENAMNNAYFISHNVQVNA